MCEKGGQPSELPDVPVLAGGETDFLIGILYNYYQPRLVHILPTGLAIYKSMFAGVNGARGCVGGPHELFRQCERQFLESNNNSVAQFKVFVQQQIQLFNTGIRVCLDVGMLNTSQFQYTRVCAPAAINADAVNNQIHECDKTSKLEVVEDAGASDAQENNCLSVVAAVINADAVNNQIHECNKTSRLEVVEDAGASDAQENNCLAVAAANPIVSEISKSEHAADKVASEAPESCCKPVVAAEDTIENISSINASEDVGVSDDKIKKNNISCC